MTPFTRIGLLGLALIFAGCGDSSTDTASGDPDAPPVPTVTEESGTLSSSDATLDDTGEYYDTYEVLAKEGQWIRIEMLSSDFDPYLIVISPTGVQTDVDDSQRGNLSLAKAIVLATESGNWTIGATSFESGEAGAYTLSYEVLDEKPEDAAEGRQAPPEEADADSTTV